MSFVKATCRMYLYIQNVQLLIDHADISGREKQLRLQVYVLQVSLSTVIVAPFFSYCESSG